MASLSDIYGEAFKGVKYWLINPIKCTVVFILDNALKLAASIIALPIFLLMYPIQKIVTSGLFNHPPPRPNRFAERMDAMFESPPGYTASRGGPGFGKSPPANTFPKLRDNATGASPRSEINLDYTDHASYIEPTKRMNMEFESTQPAIEVSRTEYEKIKREMRFEHDKIYIAVIGGTGVGKSSLVNGIRGLRNKATDAAPVGETDCTKSVKRYKDPRFPWIVWCDVPGAGTQDRSTARYFEQYGLFLMDFILVVCASRLKELDMEILQRAHHYKIPAALVRSKADEDLRQRAERECDDSSDEEEVKSQMKRVKKGYVKEVKEDLMKEVEKAGLQEYITTKNCFLVSAKFMRELMRNSQDLLALEGLDENSWKYKSAEIKAAVVKHVDKLTSKAEQIDEVKLLEMVFTSVAESRYPS